MQCFTILYLQALTSIFVNIIEKVQFEVHEPHHVSLLVLNPLTNLTRHILNGPY